MPLLWCVENSLVCIQLYDSAKGINVEFKRALNDTIGSCLKRILLKCALAPEEVNLFNDEGSAFMTITRESLEAGSVEELELVEALTRAHFIRLDSFNMGLDFEQELMIGLPVIMASSQSTVHLKCEWYLVDEHQLEELWNTRKRVSKKNKYNREDVPRFSLPMVYGNLDIDQSYKAGEGFRWYLPSDMNIIGKVLLAKVSISTEIYSVIYNGQRIKGPPPICHWNVRRHAQLSEWNRERAKDTSSVYLRVCSWNILAPVYASTSYAKESMFPYCNESWLTYSYRKSLLAHEIDLINADINCFQEVGKEVYNNLLTSYQEDYDLRLYRKMTKADEGCAIMVRRSRFTILADKKIVFKRVFMEDLYYRSLREEVNALWGGEFCERVLSKMSCVFGLLWVRDLETGRNCVVVNTHLYWHPLGGHIRTLQCYVGIREAMRLAEGVNEIILCGDLNADEGTGAIDLLTKGFVNQDHDIWKQAGQYKYGDSLPDEADEASPSAPATVAKGVFSESGPALKLELCVNVVNFNNLEFTNNIGVFKANLDWIFSTKMIAWTLDGVRSCDVEEYEGKDVHIKSGVYGLPTAAFPSDHIPLVADFFSS